MGATLAFKLVLPLALAGLGGCSLVFIDGPPSAHAAMQQFSCDESKVWPAIDGGLAALSVVGIILAETQVDTTRFLFGGYDTNTTYRSEQVVSNAVGLALFGTSAFIGNRRVNRCRNAYAELRDRLNAQRVQLLTVPGPDLLASDAGGHLRQRDGNGSR